MDTEMNYLEFWKTRGLDFIIPPETADPEGFDIAEVLIPLCPGNVLEIGCGTGRIAKFFDTNRYKGIDINPDAVAVARAALPHHSFEVLESDEPVYSMLQHDAAIFYTVCLHIPDDRILDALYGAGQSANRIVIAEIMNPKYRENRDNSLPYDLSNQRSLAEYEELMKEIGFALQSSQRLQYAFYPGEHITFAVFERTA